MGLASFTDSFPPGHFSLAWKQLDTCPPLMVYVWMECYISQLQSSNLKKKKKKPPLINHIFKVFELILFLEFEV